MAKIPNLNNLMNMAQDMAKKMEEQMSQVQVEGNAGGGMVMVRINGHKQVVDLKIAPEVVDPEEVEMLQDLVQAALNDAMAKVDEQLKGAMGGMAGGLPGGFPFPGR